MKTKTRVVRFRVTEDQYFVMKKACGDNMSKWILGSLHYNSEEQDKVSLSLTNEAALSNGDHVNRLIPKSHNIDPDTQCRSPGCTSKVTRKYERST